MPDMENVIKGLHDIGGFIAGRIGIAQARNFLRTIDDAIDLTKEQDSTINELQNAYGYLQKQFFEVQDKLLKQDSVEHACEILRANGWKETEPICSECNAVHVVLCKDCKYLNAPANGVPFCKRIKKFVDADWFCAEGEKSS